MPRTKQPSSRPELTESWAAVDGDEDDEGSTEEFTDEEVDDPSHASVASRRFDMQNTSAAARMSKSGNLNTKTSGQSTAREAPTGSSIRKPRRAAGQRMSKSVAEPKLVMPSMRDRQQDHPLAASTPQNPRARSAETTPRGRGRPPGSKNRKDDAPPTTDWLSQVLYTTWSNLLLPTARYAISTLQLAAGVAKPLFAYLFLAWLVIGGLIIARNMLTSTLTSALAPICHIPGARFLDLPFCLPRNHTQETGPVEFDRLITAQAAFEDVLTTSAGGASLPLEMKRSEGSIRDLRQVVKYSTLPSRNELVFEFSGFIDTARQASGDLSRYNTRIGSAVDRILSTNRWTLQVLDGIAATDASTGSVARFFSNHLDVFAPFRADTPLTQDVLFEQYIRHTSAIEDQIQLLIREGQALLGILDNLDQRLEVISDIAKRDGMAAEGNRDELFSLIWTKLGGNRSSVQKLEKQLNVLNDVGAYRRLAWAHVSGTMLKLQAIAANLEDLRERVARPETVGIRKDLPLEMHVREILMGVDRLETVREEGRKIEGERLQGILGRSERLGVDAGA